MKPLAFFTGVLGMLTVGLIGQNFQQYNEYNTLAFQYEEAANERDAALALYHEGVLATPYPKDQVLDAIRCLESSCDKQKVRYEGDLFLPRCGRSMGPYQVRVSTAKWLVQTKRLNAPLGCDKLREWLQNEKNGRYAATVYLDYLVTQTGSLGPALCGYRHGQAPGLQWCKRAEQVLSMVEG